MSEGNGSNGAAPKMRPRESIVTEKTVKSPSTGWSYRIRRLRPHEFFAVVGGLADLHSLLPRPGQTKGAGEGEPPPANPKALERSWQLMGEGVLLGLVDPKLETIDEAFALGIQEVRFLSNKIAALTGWTQEAAEEVAPLSETGGSSSISTDSREGTAVDRPILQAMPF